MCRWERCISYEAFTLWCFDDSTIKCSETNDNQTHDDENSSDDKDVVTSVLSRQNQTGNPIDGVISFDFSCMS